jgi:hypothetical protein
MTRRRGREMILFPGCKCCGGGGGGCITGPREFSDRMTDLFTVENFNSGEIFKHLQITGIDFTGATASMYPYTPGRRDTLSIKLANGGEVLLYSFDSSTGKYGWQLQYCLFGFLGSTGPCQVGTSGTVPWSASASAGVSISPLATGTNSHPYTTEWYSDESETSTSPPLASQDWWRNYSACIDGSDTFIDLNYQVHDPVTVTFTEYMRPRFCGDCLPVCYDTGTEEKCITSEDIDPSWTTDYINHPTLADCAAVCGDGPPGNPCDCPENKAPVAKVEYFDAVFDHIPPGSSATPEQITEGLAIANATEYTLTAGTGFVWVPDITMPNVPSVGVDCETRPGQDVGGGDIVLIEGTGGLNAQCDGKLFGAVATLKSYYTKEEWDSFCAEGGLLPRSPDRLVLTFDPFDGGGGGAALTDSWHSCGSQDQVFEHLAVYGIIQQNHPENYAFVFNSKVRVTFSSNPLP